MRCLRTLSFCVLLIGIVGCSKSTETADRDTSNLRLLAATYAQFLNHNAGNPPANEEEFKQFIQENYASAVEQAGLASVDEAFTSERDGQPYVIFYGKRAASPGSHGIVGYEQQGADSKRYVGFQSGNVQELDAGEVDAMVAPRKKKR